jgi:tetratricopeptide (TPR) repeat protein
MNPFHFRFPPTSRLVAGCCLLWLTVLTARADEAAFTNALARAALAGQSTNWPGALKEMAAAAIQAGTNCARLCQVTKCYCDLMHLSGADNNQQRLAELALGTAQRAVQADPRNATAHLCVAVCYVKNFPYAPNARKVVWSRAIKSECETAIALDPHQDVGYYLLGRWEFGVANMNFLIKGLVRLVYGGLPAASNAEAIQDFQKAIALAPRRIIHHAELAKVYAATGELKPARREWETCVALNPVDADDADAQAEARQQLAGLTRNHD